MHPSNEQNYWPGYLDALINVMLTLLFMVAIFAIGLVLLNSQIQAKRSQIDIMAEHAKEVLDGLDIDQTKREALLAKTVQAQVHASAAAVNPQDATLDVAGLTAELRDRRQRLAQMDQEILQARTPWHPDNARGQPTPQNAAEAPSEQVIDFRVAAKTERMVAAESAPKPTEAVWAHTGLQVQLVWTFDAHELNWPPNRPVPVGLADLRRTDNWRLVGYARPDNNREAREVFARLKSVREQLIRQGFARDRIGVELRSTADLPAADVLLPRHVLMVTPQPSMQ